MQLFFNWVSSSWYIALLDEQKNIIASEKFEIQGNESTQTIPIIDNFLADHSIEYSQVQTIICVAGPGSFTGIRTISLVVNTLAYIHAHISLVSINFFDLYSEYPIVKSSSKRDLFVKISKTDIIQVMSNGDFESLCQHDTIFWDTNPERFTKSIHIRDTIDYKKVVKNVAWSPCERISPLYIKKPNIS